MMPHRLMCTVDDSDDDGDDLMLLDDATQVDVDS